MRRASRRAAPTCALGPPITRTPCPARWPPRCAPRSATAPPPPPTRQGLPQGRVGGVCHRDVDRPVPGQVLPALLEGREQAPLGVVEGGEQGQPALAHPPPPGGGGSRRPRRPRPPPGAGPAARAEAHRVALRRAQGLPRLGQGGQVLLGQLPDLAQRGRAPGQHLPPAHHRLEQARAPGGRGLAGQLNHVPLEAPQAVDLLAPRPGALLPASLIRGRSWPSSST